MSEERQGDMTSASLPAGSEPGALHLHLWTHAWPTTDGVERPERRCECGAEQTWVDHDDGHAGGLPHFCHEDREAGIATITVKLKHGQTIEVEQGTLF